MGKFVTEENKEDVSLRDSLQTDPLGDEDLKSVGGRVPSADVAGGGRSTPVLPSAIELPTEEPFGVGTESFVSSSSSKVRVPTTATADGLSKPLFCAATWAPR